jgi:hypothetical protein
MSDYCNCCSTNNQHITNHYDPMGITKPDEDPAKLLAELRAQWGDECDLNLRDVQTYIDSITPDEPEDD